MILPSTRDKQIYLPAITRSTFKLAGQQTSKSITITCTQGDSLEFEAKSIDVPIFDSNWTASWGITSSLGKVLMASGTCSINTNSITCTMPAGITTGFKVGTYIFIIEAINPVIRFRQEVLQRAVKLLKQGIL